MLREPRPRRTSAVRTIVLTVVIAACIAAAAAGCGATSDTADAHRLTQVGHAVQRTVTRTIASGVAGGSGGPGVPGELPHAAASRRGLTLADGEVPAGTTVLDDSVPAVARLDPALEAALRKAATDAARDGLELDVNSGWRSIAYQRELFEQAIQTYGSEEAAARWVARPGTSVHEAGEAVDLGPTATTSWLDEHGASYGLCRVYANEPWHFELRRAAVTDGCPAMYADAAHDPRMQR